MGLSKQMEINGVPTEYHRVAVVGIVTNRANLIEVHSYVSEAKRADERAALESGSAFGVRVEASSYHAPYDQGMTVAGAYEYLKSLPQFEGAGDVMEDDAE